MQTATFGGLNMNGVRGTNYARTRNPQGTVANTSVGPSGNVTQTNGLGWQAGAGAIGAPHQQQFAANNFNLSLNDRPGNYASRRGSSVPSSSSFGPGVPANPDVGNPGVASGQIPAWQTPLTGGIPATGSPTPTASATDWMPPASPAWSNPTSGGSTTRYQGPLMNAGGNANVGYAALDQNGNGLGTGFNLNNFGPNTPPPPTSNGGAYNPALGMLGGGVPVGWNPAEDPLGNQIPAGTGGAQGIGTVVPWNDSSLPPPLVPSSNGAAAPVVYQGGPVQSGVNYDFTQNPGAHSTTLASLFATRGLDVNYGSGFAPPNTAQQQLADWFRKQYGYPMNF